MSPEKIIQQLREHLLRRVIARNPLLHFRQTERGFKKMDICALFQNIFEEQGFSNNASDFFNALMENGETRIQDGSYGRHLIKMQKEAIALERATGLGSVVLGWPLANIVRQKNEVPLCAPLFFWKVTIGKRRNNSGFVISLENEDIKPEANFVLRAWWNHHKNTQISNWDFDEGEANRFSAIRKKTIEIAKMLNCNFNNGNVDILPYAQDSQNNCFLPSATLGIANFKGQALLKELEDLAKKHQNGAEQNSLLSDFLSPQIADETRSPEAAVSPPESGRYLAGESDPSQEKCIWQTRKKQTKVLLLKGPPGTGKSETIVNLIADAVCHDKFVVVACHKQTAIDVLEKRLQDKGMGGLAVKTTNPRKDRKRVIKQIRETESSNSSVNINKRNFDAKIIEMAEHDCTRYAEIISQENATHSAKGHFRAKIDNVAAQKDCGYFNAFDPDNNELIDGAQALAGEGIFFGSKEEENRVYEIIRQHAKQHKQCDFSNNPWKGTKKGYVDIDQLQILWSRALEVARQTQQEATCLPSPSISEFMTSKLALPYLSQFSTRENQNAMEKFSRLVSQTKRAFALAGMPAHPLWKKVYANEAVIAYEQYLANIRHIPTIINIREQWDQNLIIGLLHAYLDDSYILEWHKILEAIFCRIALKAIVEKINEIENGFDFQRFSLKIDALKRTKEQKKLQDIQYVLEKQNHCLTAIENLRRADLLRLARGGRIPATTLRSLYHNGGDDLKSVAPVLMTNPDSLCQLLPLEPDVIDLAIVDEASQMFTADALPILFRAKQIVVSGDNMQMPPDDLFALAEGISDEGQSDDESNVSSSSQDDEKTKRRQDAAVAEGCFDFLEAIDVLLNKDSSARCELEVHYRSRPAELIAFSNHAFYRGKLQVAADNGALPSFMQTPIQMIPTAGEFIDGINEKEANKIIELLKEIWRHTPSPSVGVIVCNVKQAEYLKNRIEEECEKDEEFQEKLEAASSQIKDGEDVHFFVRSIEHMQGDERDVIILATTYGDRVKNYGPLNTNEKGRRRLNVAVTRAKLGMFVVTSLNINNISNNGERPDNTGEGKGKERWYLWQYLKYARAISNKNAEGAIAVLRELNANYAPRPTGQEPDSEFEIQVGDFLESKGFHVDYQVGEGGFRIDLGVKKNKSDRYLCGIECDGRTWHSGWRARQNDIWRQGILEGKGWKIYRIWSDYWFGNKEEAQKDLLGYLEVLQSNATTAEN